MVWRAEGTGTMHGFKECMALKNAWLGDKIEPEGGMAWKNAGFGEREWIWVLRIKRR